MSAEEVSPGAALARLRWSKVPPAERRAIARELAKAKWEATSEEERKAHARKMVQAREARRRAKRPKGKVARAKRG
jgi:hypothetical protein